ncbi:S8 family peptidase [Bacillus cereus group sp. TH152-1LC]|uniref:S8 family peptidase n=1 Tax=Bacillus cereus group sp. TH152-1LC TaxID=3018060 RepID=UPI0022E3C614|nr:S8/S53 family peptidase [Bacillus cereus group sp. TH152-1LC]MDA1676804.1 S8/S53 family peptidase [Bacillus cereus group sp. TH152-1LC]
MSNVDVIIGQFILVYREKLCREDKKCFFNKIGATFVKDIGVKNELEMDLITLSKSNELWAGFDLELDAERIATHIELVSGQKLTCIPDKYWKMEREESRPIFQRGYKKMMLNLCGPNNFPGNPYQPPNDPLYKNQWGIENTAIDQVWKEFRIVGADVRIGVFDSGSDSSHQDLHTTFVKGYNFTNIPVDEPHNTQDIFGHGTKVSGIIAATTNNGEGIAAVAPGSKVIPFKVVGNDGLIVLSGWIDALSFVINESEKKKKKIVDIINMSIAKVDLDGKEKEPLTFLINKIVEELGIPVVAAAGNRQDIGKEVFPALLRNVIAVTAIEADNQIYDGGKVVFKPEWVNIAAPGGTIWTTIVGPNKYGIADGTSYATPIVSGILALMLELVNRAGLLGVNKASYLSKILYDSATMDLKNPETNEKLPYGRVNALKAMEMIKEDINPPERTNPECSC